MFQICYNLLSSNCWNMDVQLQRSSAVLELVDTRDFTTILPLLTSTLVVF